MATNPDIEFECEVRRIARLLWPDAAHGGAQMIAGRERDGVFESAEEVHIIECTTSRSRDKAIQDVKKLKEAIKFWEQREPTKSAKGWFVTKDELTADQATIIRDSKARVVGVSFDQFRAKLVNAKEYLDLRGKYPFGSVADPETGNAVSEINYVELNMVDTDGHLYSVDATIDALQAGKRFILLGDYGAGKSSTMREFFLRLRKKYLANKTLLFPILLNLRDHLGQSDPVEALDRHAYRVGFGYNRGTELVRALRAGYAVLLLDGFDEIATTGWASRTKKLREIRKRSMELVKNFIEQTPQESGIVVSGRAHFFDNDEEMMTSLGADNKFRSVSLNDFTAEQVTDFLAAKGWHEAVPSWLPARPLLLSYLASRNLLRQTLEVDAGSGPAAGWHALLDRISEREAKIAQSVDADSVRQLIERLATLGRASIGGLGNLLPEQLVKAFTEVCGYPPDDNGTLLIQRLPGLGVHNPEDGTRKFIDVDFASVAAAGDVFRFIADPFTNHLDDSAWQASLPTIGIETIAHRSYAAKFPEGKLSAAVKEASDNKPPHTLCADIVRTIMELSMSYKGSVTTLRDVEIPELVFHSNSTDMQGLVFQGALIGVLELSHEVPDDLLPNFSGCYFGSIEGRTGLQDLPSQIDQECIVDKFDDDAATTSSILKLELPVGTKVLLTILKKLYVQKGAGRRQSALYRGLDHKAQSVVADVLKLLQKEGFVTLAHYTDQIVWLPVRSAEAQRRALRILGAPNECHDQLVSLSSKIG